MKVYLKHQSYTVSGINSNRHTGREVATIDDPMNVLLDFADGEGRVGATCLKGSYCLGFKVLPFKLLAILIPHQDLADKHSLLRAPLLGL